ncbi:MAG: ribonuclease D, partial [Pseudomonadota bacterium]
QQQPDDERALGRLRMIYKGVERSAAGKAVLEIVADVKAMDRDDLPKVPRPAPSPEGTGAAVDLLKVLLKLTAEEHDVAQKIIANANQLEQIAIHGEDANVDAMKGWRRDIFGDRALELLNGGIALAFDNRKITTIIR